MDLPVIPLVLNASTAFGLAAAAGLNTSLTLLLVGLLARFGLLTLAPPYDLLGTNVALGVLGLLAVLELLGDKVPGLDSVIHTVQWPIASAAGAILFASQTAAISGSAPDFATIPWSLAPEDGPLFTSQLSALTGFPPVFALLLGLLTAGAVHAARVAARPLVTGLTAGAGNPAVSLAEDVYALTLASASVFVPAVGLLLLIVLLLLVGVAGTRAIQRSVRLSSWLRGR